MTEQCLKRKLEKICNKLDYKFSYHQCRHTYVTLLYNADIDIKQAQKWTGHKDITVLLNTYTHLSEQNNNENINKLDTSVSKVYQN